MATRRLQSIKAYAVQTLGNTWNPNIKYNTTANADDIQYNISNKQHALKKKFYQTKETSKTHSLLSRFNIHLCNRNAHSEIN